MAELLGLRGEVGRLRRELAQLKSTGPRAETDPNEAVMKSWMERVNKLKERLIALYGDASPASKRARRSAGRLVMFSMTVRAATRSWAVMAASCSGACGL